MARAPDADNDAGSHPLNRSGRHSRGRGRRRFGRGNFLRNHLGRGHHGLLGGGLLQHLSTLLSLIGLLAGLFKHHKHVGRGSAGRNRKPRKTKIARHRSPRGIRRPAASPQPRSPGAATRGSTTFVTGVFNVTTRKLQRRRLLG